MEPVLGEAYATLHSHHWWWRAREAFLLEQIRRRGLCDGRRILDVGCASGVFLPAVAHCGDVFGLEPDPLLRSQSGVWQERIHPGPLDSSFTPDRPFGLILMLDVLEHMPDPEAALRQAIRLLEPEGTLLITVPAFQFLWTRHDDINEHYVRFNRHSFRRLAQQAGLQVHDMRYFFQWLVLPKLLVRLSEAVISGEPRPPRIPATWLNRGLYIASRLEQRVFRQAAPPWGTSLLVVGGRG
jgi:SAM-dependent methyltransferase